MHADVAGTLGCKCNRRVKEHTEWVRVILSSEESRADKAVGSSMVGGHMINVIPQEGRWYAYRGNRELYQVINVDDSDRVIYFQDSRGDIDEVDFDEWSAMDLELLTDLEELDQIGEDEQDDYRPDYAPARHQVQVGRR